MLIFFIHGVATRDVKYAEPLKIAIKEKLKKYGVISPCFYSSFWGNASSNVDRMWRQIDRDINAIEQIYPEVNVKECFRYREFREGFLSEFVGDMFTYLNEQHGYEIRKLIAQQLIQFVKNNCQETELHIISHSLGSVILWDILFSERFKPNDPAFDVRSLIQNLGNELKQTQINLKSVTTMGSPILLFNNMFGVNPNRIKNFFQKNQSHLLKWINIIHPSDIIAYPLKSSFNLNASNKLQIKDIYIDTDNNLAAKAARSMGQEIAAMALDAIAAHTKYWSYERIAQLIVDNLQDETSSQCLDKKLLQEAISCLKKVPGMSLDKLKLHINDNPVDTLNFSDGSGKLFHVINTARVHHVYLFDEMNLCCFAGYVGWIHINGLKETIKLIKNYYC